MPRGLGHWITVGGTIIELLAALVVAFHACRALVAIVQSHDADQPRLMIAEGVLAALGFSVAGTLLKALGLQSWHDIGMFAFVLAFRTLLKQVLKENVNRSSGEPARCSDFAYAVKQSSWSLLVGCRLAPLLLLPSSVVL